MTIHQDNPVYTYHSDRADLTLQLPDSYEARNDMLLQLNRDANNWFELALGRAPVELHSTLQVRPSQGLTEAYPFLMFTA